MTSRRCPVLLVAILLGGPGVCRAQLAPESGSHKTIGIDLSGAFSPEDLLQKRLNKVNDAGPAPDPVKLPPGLLDKESLRELAKTLMEDPELLKLVREQLNPQQIDSLRKKLKEGQDVSGDESLKQLLAGKESLQKLTGSGRLTAGQQKTLQEMGKAGGLGPTPAPAPGQNPVAPPGVAAPPAPPDASGWDRIKEETPDWLKDRVRDLVNDPSWVEAFAGKDWRETLGGMAKRLAEQGGRAPDLARRAGGFTRYLPRLSGYLPRDLLRRASPPPLPSLPRFRGVRLPSGGAPNLTALGSGKVLGFLAVLGVLGLVLWRAGGWWEQVRQARAGLARAWRLGPWPVRPADVSTRADLVRAFEHLALLCLGRSARTCHHIELARRIGEQPAGEPDRRRAAAASLARLYEEARYAPDDGPLPADRLAGARRDLGYLAGVAAA
jgi:hypothetical protein